MIEPTTGLIATLRAYTRHVQLAPAVRAERFTTRYDDTRAQYIVERGALQVVPSTWTPIADPHGERRALSLCDALNRIYDNGEPI